MQIFLKTYVYCYCIMLFYDAAYKDAGTLKNTCVWATGFLQAG